MLWNNSSGIPVHRCDQGSAQQTNAVWEMYFSRVTNAPMLETHDVETTINYCPFCGTDLRDTE